MLLQFMVTWVLIRNGDVQSFWWVPTDLPIYASAVLRLRESDLNYKDISRKCIEKCLLRNAWHLINISTC